MKLCLSVEKSGIVLLLITLFLPLASSTSGLVMRLRRRYELLRRNGDKVCAVGTPSQTFTKVRTRMSCSAKCAQLSNCERFNFKKHGKTCEIFVTNQTDFDSVENCDHYQLKGVPAPKCSFPFTLDGQLHHQCISPNADWRAFDEVGCFVDDRRWTNCLNPKDFFAIPEPVNVTIRVDHHMIISVLSIHNWIVIAQRIDGSLSFNRNWQDYKVGFGTFDNASSNFWLGNEKLHLVTEHHDRTLRVEFQFRETGDWYSAEYNSFRIDDEGRGYMLHVAGFSGDIGDSLSRTVYGGANEMKFSTPDRDNDVEQNRHCAQEYQCGWWMNDCYTANFNGLYDSGMEWSSANDDQSLFPGGTLREVRMMISRGQPLNSVSPD